MKVHLSIDDVILSLKELYESNPKSVFDIPFFRCLKSYNEKYGARFSLYTFVKYKDFFISQIPKGYWNELTDASEWLRFGFHGTHKKEDLQTFSDFCNLFYSVIPSKLLTSTLRVHRYMSTEEEVNVLKAHGVTELLCRDEESRKRLQAPPSYDLDESEFQALSKTILMKNGITYRKTNIQIELYYQRNELEECLNREMEKMTDDLNLVIFTHEIQIPKNEILIDQMFEMLKEKKAEYTF